MSGGPGGSEDRTTVSPAAVELRQASVRIDGRTVLGPVDLRVGRGERWVLLGPNGGGKTTLLALAGARRQPSSGRVAVLGATLGSADVRAIHPEDQPHEPRPGRADAARAGRPDRRADGEAGGPVALVPGLRRGGRAPRGGLARPGGLRPPRRAAVRHVQPGGTAAGPPRPRPVPGPGAADPRRAGLGAGSPGAGDPDRGPGGRAGAIAGPDDDPGDAPPRGDPALVHARRAAARRPAGRQR